MEDEIPSTSGAIDSTNVGFQLLKKCGWKEGTGLGVLEKGRLEPVKAYVKNDKRGLGAEETRQSKLGSSEGSSLAEKREKHLVSQKKPKGLTKRMRKMLEEDKRAAEVEFAREFFRLMSDLTVERQPLTLHQKMKRRAYLERFSPHAERSDIVPSTKNLPPLTVVK